MGASLVSVTTIEIEVTVKRPQDAAPLTIDGVWTLESAASYVRDQQMTLPAGSVVSIVVRIGDPPQGQD